MSLPLEEFLQPLDQFYGNYLNVKEIWAEGISSF